MITPWRQTWWAKRNGTNLLHLSLQIDGIAEQFTDLALLIHYGTGLAGDLIDQTADLHIGRGQLTSAITNQSGFVFIQLISGEVETIPLWNRTYSLFNDSERVTITSTEGHNFVCAWGMGWRNYSPLRVELSSPLRVHALYDSNTRNRSHSTGSPPICHR